jgi:hypothetical protein
MAQAKFGSTKQTLINKANKRIVVSTGLAAFVLVFTLVAANTLVRQLMYQNRVIGERESALRIARDGVEASEDLKKSYDGFLERPRNLIGGNPLGVGPNDGNNAKIVLNALPSSYDFPALTSSMEKLVAAQGMEFINIVGFDDAVAQQANQSSAQPQPIEMPLEITVKGSYSAAQNLIRDFERSIRPFQIISQEYTADGENGEVSMRLSLKTYFQPAKNLEVKKEVVK